MARKRKAIEVAIMSIPVVLGLSSWICWQAVQGLRVAFKTMGRTIRVGKDGTVYRLVPEDSFQKIARKISKHNRLSSVET